MERGETKSQLVGVLGRSVSRLLGVVRRATDCFFLLFLDALNILFTRSLSLSFRQIPCLTRNALDVLPVLVLIIGPAHLHHHHHHHHVLFSHNRWSTLDDCCSNTTMGFPERYAIDTPALDVHRLPRAINPIFIWVTRMLLVLATCALSLCVLVTSILTVKVRLLLSHCCISELTHNYASTTVVQRSRTDHQTQLGIAHLPHLPEPSHAHHLFWLRCGVSTFAVHPPGRCTVRTVRRQD